MKITGSQSVEQTCEISLREYGERKMIAGHWKAGAVGVALLAFLTSCGQPSAGNSVETENSIGMRTLPVDSFLPSWNHPLWGTVATLRFDRTNFNFSASTSDGRDIRFERMDSTPIHFLIDVWDSAAAQGRILVRLDPPLVLPWSAIRMIWGLHQAPLSNPDSVWAGVPDSVSLLVNSVNVDDFEDGNLTTSLSASGVWVTGASDYSSTAQQVASAGNGRPGQALHATYNTASPNFTVVGVPLSTGPRNLRSLDSIVFFVRGTGTVRVALAHLANGLTPKAWMQFSLDTVWQRKAVRPSDFDTILNATQQNVGWANVRDSVTDLDFVLADGKDFWVDDIRLFGVDRDDLK